MRKLFTQLICYAVWVSPLTVALVDKGQTRNAVAAHLTVNSDRLRLNTSYRAEHEHGAVKNAKRALNFYRKVYVTRSIDKVDVVIAPRTIRGSRLNGNSLFALKIHRVHLGSNAVLTADFVDSMDFARIVQNALRQRGLARVMWAEIPMLRTFDRSDMILHQ